MNSTPVVFTGLTMLPDQQDQGEDIDSPVPILDDLTMHCSDQETDDTMSALSAGAEVDTSIEPESGHLY